MFRKTVLALGAATGLALVSLPTAALAVGPGFPATLPTASPAVEQATFWARPFPYGYVWHRHPQCMRVVEERDFWGVVHTRRVWVCDP
jgi:hypothetical protein